MALKAEMKKTAESYEEKLQELQQNGRNLNRHQHFNGQIRASFITTVNRKQMGIVHEIPFFNTIFNYMMMNNGEL